MEGGVRLDKWLWAVRIYKTRTLATDACKNGRVKQDDVLVKPSREVQVGDVFAIRIDQLTRLVRVRALLNNRVSAKEAEKYVEDLTSKEEYQRVRLMRQNTFELRDKNIGRPSKRDRRSLMSFKNELYGSE